MLLVAASVILPAFSSTNPLPGGEGYAIYLNNKLVIQKFGEDMKKIQQLNLAPADANSQLSVNYYHCGKIGKNRELSIRDEGSKVLAHWRYKDAASTTERMSCRVKEIMKLNVETRNKLTLFYSSSELPKGRVLAEIRFSGQDLAGR